MSLQTDYDAWHASMHEDDPEHDDATSPWYQLVRERIGDVAGLRILEVACGRGGFVREMSRAKAKVVGCDFSAMALQVGRGKLRMAGDGGQASLVQGDAQMLAFGEETFDCVISCETIEHLPDQHAALREMWRVTKPGGRLFLTTPNYANFMGLYDFYARFRHPGRKDNQPFDRRQWFYQVLRWVREARWKIVATDGTVHQFPFIPGRNPVLVRALESPHALRKLLSPLAYHFFVLAEKRVAG